MDPPPLPPHPTAPTTTSSVTSTTSAGVATANGIHVNYPDSVDSSPRSLTTDTGVYDHEAAALPPVPGAKLRLMCSYGGHIMPRPHDKSLCYVGGETRLIAVDRRSSLSSLCSRLSRSLVSSRHFTLKYQLPNEDLDSLVSVTTDEDLENMIEEYDRLMASSASSLKTSSRIRLFLFFKKPETAASMGAFLEDAKSETWFVDALNGSGLLPRGLSDTTVDCLLNLDNENENDLESQPNHHHLLEVDDKQVKNVTQEVQYSTPNSPMVDTTSSFGSSSSSPSMSNLPPIRVRVRVEDQKANGIEEQFAMMSFGHSGLQIKQQQDEGGEVVLSGAPPPLPVAVANAPPPMSIPMPSENTSSRVLSDDERSDQGVPVRLRKPPLPLQPVQHKAGPAYNLPSPDSVASDSSIASACSLSKPISYQDQVGTASGENKGPTSPSTQSNITIPSSEIQDSGYVLPTQLDLQQQQQQPHQQFVHSSMHYIPHHVPSQVPISSYYAMYAPPQEVHHPIDQQYPVYVMPLAQTQPYMPVKSNIAETSVYVGSSRPLTHPNSTMVASSAAYKEGIPPVYPTKTTQTKAEMPATVHRTAGASTPLVQIPANQFQQQFVGYSQVQHTSPFVDVAPAASANYGCEYANPASHEQIYYPYHQAAPLPPQHQTMTATAAVQALANASKQLPAD